MIADENRSHAVNISSTASSSSTAVHHKLETYEEMQAKISTIHHPDKIRYNPNLSYRNQPYRYLHHQSGISGYFHLQLVEARDLRRHGWSVLGLGPMKSLGLSKAVGDVSSYAKFWLEFVVKDHYQDYYGNQPMKASKFYNYPSFNQRKNAPSQKSKTVRSSVISKNNSPIWNPYDPKTESKFQIPVSKHDLIQEDGMSIYLHVCVEEDRTAVEQILPLGVGGTGEGAVLGEGLIDLSSFLLGKQEENFNSVENDADGIKGLSKNNTLRGALDVWVDLHPPNDYTTNQTGEKASNNNSDFLKGSISKKIQEDQKSQKVYLNSKYPSKPSHTKQEFNGNNDDSDSDLENTSECGRIRIILSYHPNGMNPQINDICCLESFARISLSKSMCPPILPPLSPFRICNIKYPYYWIEYEMESSSAEYDDIYEGGHPQSLHSSTKEPIPKMGKLRIHRNTFFCDRAPFSHRSCPASSSLSTVRRYSVSSTLKTNHDTSFSLYRYGNGNGFSDHC